FPGLKMSQRPHTFNIFSSPAPSTSSGALLGYGGGNLGAGSQPNWTTGSGTPMNFYFHGRNNNVDIRIYPAPGSNINIYGQDNSVPRSSERQLPWPLQSNRVNQDDTTHDTTYDEMSLLHELQESLAQPHGQTQTGLVGNEMASSAPQTTPTPVDAPLPAEVEAFVVSDQGGTAGTLAKPTDSNLDAPNTSMAITSSITRAVRSSTRRSKATASSHSSRQHQEQLQLVSSSGMQRDDQVENTTTNRTYFNGTEIRNLLVTMLILVLLRYIFEAVTISVILSNVNG
ncbi:hypothetical protein Ocin01_04314, partial [Orchesella cincta]